MLKVRLENTYNILDRTLTTLDENPQVVEELLETPTRPCRKPGTSAKRERSRAGR